MSKEKAIEILEETYNWSQNSAVTVWSDFVRMAHTDYNFQPTIDFENYGYMEFVLLSKCLSLLKIEVMRMSLH